MERTSKTKTPKVSIILPCYNVEEYLPAALDSLLRQTLHDIEIIPVDDGSPDGCRRILKQYERIDPRIKPVYQENRGYGGAINTGMRNSSGTYIAILEPDDFVSNTYYEILYNVAERNALDVCGVSSYSEIREQVRPRLMQSWYAGSNGILSNRQIDNCLASAAPGITLKIYKRDFLSRNKIAFDESISAYLDILFVTLVLLCRPRMKIIKGVGYYYRKGHAGQSTSNPKAFENILKLVDLVLEHALSKNFGTSRRFLAGEQKQALFGSLVAHLVSYHKKGAVSKLDTLVRRISEKIEELLKMNDAPLQNKPTLDFLKAKNYNASKAICATVHVVTMSEFRSQDMNSHKSGDPSFAELLAEVEFFAMYTTMLEERKVIEAATAKVVQFLQNFPGCNSTVLTYFAEWYIDRYGVYTIEMMSSNSNSFVVLSWFLSQRRGDKYNGLIAESCALFEKCRGIVAKIPELAARIVNSAHTQESSLRRAGIVWEQFRRNADDFQKSTFGKAIAVVGNAPNLIGTGSGRVIDEHDIVIRFNNYSLSNQYVADYGRKESVWVISPGMDTIAFREDMYQFDFVIFPYAGLLINEERMRFLYEALVAGLKVFPIDTFSTRLTTDVMVPSVGLYVVDYLARGAKGAYSLDIYGFSGVDALSDKRHYFEGDPTVKDKVWPHEWVRETRKLYQITRMLEEMA